MVVPRKVLEIGTVAFALIGGLANVEGYRRETVILELSAFTLGFMSLFSPGTSLIFRKI